MDDVVADVFLVAWRRLDEIPADARPWLLGTARRVLTNHARARDRFTALRERLAVDGTPNHASAPDDDTDGTVLRALARLAERDRETLLLVVWEGLEPAQAARALGVQPGTFAVRLHRARRRLAAALAVEERQDAQTPPSHHPIEVSP